MTAQEFIHFLQMEKLVPDRLQNKLQQKVNEANRPVSPQSIASYLIKKDIVSRDEADEWISRAESALGEIRERLAVTIGSEQESQATSDLLDLAGAPTGRAKQVTRDHDSPGRDDDAEFDHMDVEVLDDDVPPVASPRKAKTVPVDNVEEIDEVVELDPQQQIAGADPWMGQAQDPFAEQEETEPEEETGSVYAFGAKKRNDQWISKWPLIGSGILLVLLGLGIVLVVMFRGLGPDRLWEQANEAYQGSNWSQAYSQFKQFYESYPNHENAELARVRAVNLELRIPFEQSNWDTVMERANTRLPEVAESEVLSDIHADLATILTETARGYSELALADSTIPGKQDLLAKTESAMAEVNRPEYVPRSQRDRGIIAAVIEETENNIRKIEYQIEMEKAYEESLDVMAQLVDDGQTHEAFTAYQTLVSDYPEVESRQPMRDSLMAISNREADLVNSISVELNPGPGEIESDAEATVLLTTRVGDPVPAVDFDHVPFLIDGSVYCLSAKDGDVLWRRYVGEQTMEPPQWLGDDDLLLVDKRDHSLIRVNGRSGESHWKTVIGEPFAKPVIDRNVAYLSMLDGRVLKIDLEDGRGGPGAKLPQPIEVAGALAGREPYIYQLGSFANLYVISKDDFSCREVYFLDHRPGTVAVPPHYISGHLLVAVNGADYTNIHVLRAVERGLRLEPAQPPIRLDGRVVRPMVPYGRWAIVLTDTGKFRMLEINIGDEEAPVTVVAEQDIDSKRNLTTYMLAADGQVWVADNRMVNYRIRKTRQAFERNTVAHPLDTFLAPPQKIGEAIVHVRRRHDSALVTLNAESPDLDRLYWQTEFSAPLAGPPFEIGDQLYALNSQGDLFQLSAEAFEQETLAQTLRASNQTQSLVFDQVVALPDDRYAAVGADGRRQVVYIDFSRRIPMSLANLSENISRPSCDAIPLGQHIVLATQRGQVYRVNPADGSPVGAPFQPALSPQQDIDWNTPVRLAGDTFFISDSNGRMFVVAAEGETALMKRAELKHDDLLISPNVRMGEAVYCISRSEIGDQILSLKAAEEIVVQQQSKLPAGYIAGPFAVGESLLVVTQDGKLHAFDKDLQVIWSHELGNDALAGAPGEHDGQLVIALASGKVLRLDRNAGTVIAAQDVKLPLSGAPSVYQGELCVLGVDGAVILLED